MRVADVRCSGLMYVQFILGQEPYTYDTYVYPTSVKAVHPCVRLLYVA